MKKALIAIALSLFGSTVQQGSAPERAAADYSWQCTWQTYCNPYTGFCWQRQQCCQQVWDPFTGAYAWQCWWR